MELDTQIMQVGYEVKKKSSEYKCNMQL